jgi:hypothetical protein
VLSAKGGSGRPSGPNAALCKTAIKFRRLAGGGKTHASTTNSDWRLFEKVSGQAAELPNLGDVTTVSDDVLSVAADGGRRLPLQNAR